MKKFKLSRDDIQELVFGYGGCIASDKITVEGLLVGFMYRESPHNEMDSGWRFLSGEESDEYMSDTSNHSVFGVNTIANYDPSIIEHLDAPEGVALERASGEEGFTQVESG